MKALLKSLLPQQAINILRDTRSRQGLARLPRKIFATQNLVANDHLPLEAILQSGLELQSWASDNAQISAIFGNRDEFGGVNPGDRRALYTLIATLKPANVLEIGTHIGASTLYIACALKAVGTGKMTTVDILDVNNANASWRDHKMPACPLENARTLACDDVITFITSPSQKFMATTDQKFDFIFLDGDHNAATVYAELELALRCLAPNGIILLHDYYPSGKALFPNGSIIYGPYRALERIMGEAPALQICPLGKLPWPTKQGSNMTSLAFVAQKLL